MYDLCFDTLDPIWGSWRSKIEVHVWALGLNSKMMPILLLGIAQVEFFDTLCPQDSPLRSELTNV